LEALKVPELTETHAQLEGKVAALEPQALTALKVPELTETIAQLEVKVAALEPQALEALKVPGFAAELAGLRAVKASSEEAVARLTASLETLRADYDALEQMLDEGRREKELAQAHLAAKTLANQELEQQLQEAREAVAAAEARAAKQDEARLELEQRCHASAEADLQLRTQLEALRLDAQGAKVHLEETEVGRLAALERQDLLTREVKALQGRIATLEEENQTLGQAVKKEQDRFEEVSADLGLLEVDRRGAQGVAERLRAEGDLLREQLTQAEKLLAEHKTLLAERGHESETLASKLTEAQSGLAQVKALEGQKADLEGQVAALEEKLAKVAKKREGKDNEKKELTRQVEGLTEENGDLKTRIAALEAEIESAISVVGVPAGPSAEDLHKLEVDREALASRNATLERDLEVLTAEHKAMREQTRTLQVQVGELKRSDAEQRAAAMLTTESAREEELRSKLAEVELRLGYFKNEYDRSLNLLEERDHRIETLEAGLARLEGEGGTGRIKKLERALDAARDKASELEARLATADNERLDLAVTVEQLQASLEKAADTSGPDITKDGGATETLTVTDTAELLQLRERLEVLEKERVSLISFLEDSRKRVETERQLFLEVEENYRATIMEMNNEKEDALIRLSELEERVRRLTGTQEVQHKHMVQVLGLLKSAKDANQELSRVLANALED
jgi:chromosome segregation ATPase